MNDTQTVTLRELVRLALPPETRTWCEPEALERPVTWVLSLTASESVRLERGDLVFLLPPYPADLTTHLARWAQIGVTGIALLGEPEATLITAAQQVALPLVALPADASVRALERVALALVLNRDAALEQRATQLYQQLMLLSTENAGLSAMAALISRATGKTVLIQDKRLNILAAWFVTAESSQRAQVEKWVMSPANLPDEFRDRKRAAQHAATLEQALPLENRARVIVPIVAKGMARGFLSLLAERGTFQTFDRLVAVKGASACAVEMAKAKAVSEAEKRVRGGFVEALLAGNLSTEEAESWAKRDRYNPVGKHTVIVVDWAKKEHPSYRRLETVIHGIKRPTMLVHAREDEVIVFVRLEESGIERARLIAETIRHQTNAEFPNDPLAIGIGRATDSLVGLRESYREARQALSLARRLASPTPLYFGELSVYRLLFLLEHHPELNAFRQEMIGALIEYDKAQHTNLLETLAAYFAHKGNLTQTAEALFIHRNTLLYRMERIRAISGLDLDNPETRLGVELALRAHRLLARDET